MTSSAGQQDFALAFLGILFEGAPFILLGTLASGFLEAYLPAGAMDRLLPRKTLLAVPMAALLGIVFPVCECAVVPVIRRLVRKGLPISCALTYMLAAPIVNPITALSTWKAFQGQSAGAMTSSRLLLGFLIASAVGLLVARVPLGKVLRESLAKDLKGTHKVSEEKSADKCGCGCHSHHDHQHANHQGKHGDSDRKLLVAFRAAQKDFIDVGVYFSIGVTITALFNTGIAPGAQWLDHLASKPAQAPAALMVLAFALSLCSTSDAFIAATLDKFSWAAKLAFLTFGPMMDLKLIFLYQTVMRKRFILALTVGLFLACGGLAILWQYLFLQAK